MCCNTNPILCEGEHREPGAMGPHSEGEFQKFTKQEYFQLSVDVTTFNKLCCKFSLTSRISL